MSNRVNVREVKLTTSHLQSFKKKSKHKEGYFASYYTKNRQKYLLAQKRYRAKLKANKPVKPPSEFQQKKTKPTLKVISQ